MDRVRLLPMQLPPASSINGNNGNTKGKVSFVRRLALGFIILAGLGLLYVPAYHSAQGQFSGLGETPSPVGSVGSTHFVASVGMHLSALCTIILVSWFYHNSNFRYVTINTIHVTCFIKKIFLKYDKFFLIGYHFI